LSQYDILMKDFKDRKVEQVTTTVFGDKSVIVSKFIDFKIDRDKDNEMFDYFFIKIQREDDSIIWSRKSFSFDDIVAMDFL